MRLQIASASGFVIVAVALLVGGCKPTYPKCSSDEQCQEKGEVCVNGMCQECRSAGECASKYPGENRECVSGRCEVKAAAAPLPECTSDADCGSGMRCEEQRCVASGTKVSSSCQPADPASGDVIALGRVHFDFDKYDITASARSTLDQNAQCLQESPGVTLVLEGHADDRGTQEYNLALGEKRANTVKTYLKNLGIDTARMQTRSKGENEPLCREVSDDCWSENRRVEFIQKRGSM